MIMAHSKLSANVLRRGSMRIRGECMCLQELPCPIFHISYCEGLFPPQRCAVGPRSVSGVRSDRCSLARRWHCSCLGHIGATSPCPRVIPSAILLLISQRLSETFDVLSCCQITQHLVEPRKKSDLQSLRG